MTLSLFAVTAPGLETFTRQELQRLGTDTHLSKNTREGENAGGIEFEAGLPGLYRANLHLRTTSRILVRLGEFYAAAFSELRKKASRLPWENYLIPGQPVALRVTCHKSRLYHSDAVAERLAGAIADHLGRPIPRVKYDDEAESQPQLVVLRFMNDLCTISVDSSGSLLHRRGYRLETGKAPLRETLAAGLLMASGWDGTSPLLDPFCGSGTIPIEAALLARGIPPGKDRHFSFMDWPNFDPQTWQAVLQESRANEQLACPALLASDRDAGAMRAAQANAARAGVLDDIAFATQAFSAILPPRERGWIITNPPYGQRIRSNADLRNLYSGMGSVLRQLCPGWSFGFLCSDETLAGHTRLRFERTLSLVNGGTAVKFFMGRIE
jgi:putative N6-adenine-specific DNA methylase